MMSGKIILGSFVLIILLVYTLVLVFDYFPIYHQLFQEIDTIQLTSGFKANYKLTSLTIITEQKERVPSIVSIVQPMAVTEQLNTEGKFHHYYDNHFYHHYYVL
jgi:hypothetical protein